MRAKTQGSTLLKQWGFFSMPHLWHGTSVYMYMSEDLTNNTHACCQAFGRGAITTHFDSSLSRPGWEHSTFRIRGSSLIHCNIALFCLLFFETCSYKLSRKDLRFYIPGVGTMYSQMYREGWSQLLVCQYQNPPTLE